MEKRGDYWQGRKAVHRRALLKAAGYEDEDLRNKPHIGVANTFMEGSPGTAHLRQVAEYVKQGIWEAGGVPFEFGVPSTCGTIADGDEYLKYDQVGRDISAASIEFVCRVHHFDGLVTIGACDNVLAGLYQGMARVNIPSMCVTAGCMQAGRYRGKKFVEAELDVAVMGSAADEDVLEMEECACPSFGACPSMGTANTMQMTGEILNMVLPGTSTVPATESEKLRNARMAGRKIVEMTLAGRKPSDLCTKETFLNACAFGMAVAGSTNLVLHIMTIARELGIKITLDDFAHYAERIHCILAVIPSGPYTVVDFHYAGGPLAIMKNIESEIDTSVPTMLGGTWADLIKDIPLTKNEVIHTLDDPVTDRPGLKVLRGNLAPNGAIVRPTGLPEEMMSFRGKAKIFTNDMESYAAICDGKIKPGDMIVVRYEGSRGAPGMKELMQTSDALLGYGLHKSVGLVTDARFSGFNYGAIIGHLTPEAYDGGPIALVEEGDEISFDIRKGTIELHVSDEELEERRKRWVRPEPKEKNGFIYVYSKNCRPGDEGGAMQPWEI